MKTETDLDEIIRDLVSWKDGWECLGSVDGLKVKGTSEGTVFINEIKDSLDLVRELEEAVVEKYPNHYHRNLLREIDEKIFKNWCVLDGAMADPEPRLRALHRTLREAGEI